MRLEGPGANTFNSESKQASSYTVDDSSVSSSSTEAAMPGTSEPATQPRQTAKIHDFCLGIPFGEFDLIFPSQSLFFGVGSLSC